MNNAMAEIFRQRLFVDPPPNEMAAAIKKVLNLMIEQGLLTEDGIMCLIDAEQRDYWDLYAREVAEGAEFLIRNKVIHPNEIKPWQQCSDYPKKFEQISHQPWKGVHSALDKIVQEVGYRFRD